MFFYLSKIVWFFLTPGNFLVFALLIGMLLLYKGKTKWAKRILTVAVACFLTLIIFPIGQWLIYPLENRFETNPQLPEKVDGIIVLGGPERVRQSQSWQTVEFNEGGERLLYFSALAREYPQAKAIFSGGGGSLNKNNNFESMIAEKFLTLQGLQDRKFIFESRSRNTHENCIYSKELAVPKEGESWILVTSASHMPRAVGIFRRNNWPIIPFPVDHLGVKGKTTLFSPRFEENLLQLTIAYKEYIGLLAYHLTGKTNQLFPKQ